MSSSVPMSPQKQAPLLPKSSKLVCPANQQSMASFALPMLSRHKSEVPALVSPGSPPQVNLRPQNRSSEIAQEALAITEGSFGKNNNNALLAPRESGTSAGNKAALPPAFPRICSERNSAGIRLNKFVRRLHDMLVAEKDSGIVEWRRGLLVLHSTDAFAKNILPKYFNTKNFKTFRRQLNYYGFVHVRSFSTTGSTTTALWVNRDLAQHGSEEISSVLMLKRVEPEPLAKTAEGRRVRKELAIFTVEEDIGVSPKTLQMEQIRSLAMRGVSADEVVRDSSLMHQHLPPPAPVAPAPAPATIIPQIPTEVHCHHPVPPVPTFGSGASAVDRTVSASTTAASSTTTTSTSAAVAPNTTCASQVSSVSNSDCQPDQIESDAEDNASAAHLLLMLSRR